MEIVNKIDRFRIQDWLLKCDEQNTQDCFPKFASGQHASMLRQDLSKK